jgi:hypothetical protein
MAEGGCTGRPAVADVLRRSGDPAVLRTLDAGPAAAAIWTRALPAGLSAWLDGLVFAMPRQGRWLLPCETPVAPAVRQWMAAWLAGIAEPPGGWLRDLEHLLCLAREAFDGGALRVRLDVVSNDGCRLFHVDHLRVRWICTYRGPGTQYVPDAAVDRSRLGTGTNAAILAPDEVRSLQAGWVAALRGAGFPGAEDRAIVHRSPPAEPAAPRIVLVIDPS